MRDETIVISGSLAQRPLAGGHAWVFLQYLLGFRRLGKDVFFIDWLEPSLCGGQVETSPQAAYLGGVMERFGLQNSYSLIDRSIGRAAGGVSREEVLSRAREATFLLNVMGYLDDEEILAAVPRRVFLDIDPGFPQMWHELGLADVFAGHDDFVTIGERIGTPGCDVPTAGLNWIHTRPPVVLAEWPTARSSTNAFTSVVTWRGAFDPIEFEGTTYGLRVHEFRKFAELPRSSGRRFEVALDIHSDDSRDLTLLEENGWRLVDPVAAAGDPDRYRAYVAGSLGEFMVAKGMYVQTQSGWFSDRSVCYLASGRPVLAQDTGFDGLYPVGEGLLSFRTVDQALSGVESVYADYDRHASAARAIAQEYFDSDKVLGRLLEALQ